MERSVRLLLDVWREVGRHAELGETAARAAPLLARRLPLDLLLVRRLDVAGGWIETVATGVARRDPGPLLHREEIAEPARDALVEWSLRGGVTHAGADSFAAEWPSLLPPDLRGDVIAGPLAGTGGTPAFLLLVARPPHRFETEHAAMADALLEPFSVALESDRRLRELSSLREAAEADRRSLLQRLGRSDLQETIVGAEGGLRGSLERVELVASSDVPVLILGETGSGKEVIARAIHTRSRRAQAPFLRVNCGAIPSGLIDSELFGHERGSFTGATAQRKGWFERADGGTLFLDEVGELPPHAQIRLLRVLQDGSFERVGGQKPLHADVRVVAATHRDLHRMVADGTFREDLWYRLAVFLIHLPPLRDRLEDIPALATHFALRAATRFGKPPLAPSTDDVSLLASYDWPGNVRELASVMERAVILGDGRGLAVATALGPVRPATIARAQADARSQRPDPSSEPAAAASLDGAMARHIEGALARCHGRIEGPFGAALHLGINPHTLRARMRKLGIDWRRYRTRR